MPLPAADTVWPPASDTARYDRIRVNSTWYAGDPDALSSLYSGVGDNGQVAVVDRFAQRAVRAIRRWFWGDRPTADENDHKVHVGLAKDIATISSELLFADPPTIKVQPLEDTEQAKKRADEVQERLDEILNRSNWESLLLAAAETAAALGSCALRIAWDKDVDDEYPILTRVDADAVVPEYRWGRLVAVTLWRSWKDGSSVYRHLERHERGKVYHGLYLGDSTHLGSIQPLADRPETSYLATEVNEEGYIEVPDKHMMATSIPNMLPDPLDRSNFAGRSDFTPATLSQFDALDEVYNSLMRDIELGKGRLVVADTMLTDNGPGKGATFDTNQKIYAPLRMQPKEDGEQPLTIVQFQIRVEEHLRAAEDITARAVRSAGYNPQTMGDAVEGGTATATEVVSRERRSLSTRDKKIRYWRQALENLLEALLALDAEEFNSGFEPHKVSVQFPDAVQPDPKALAETVNLMKQAEAASTKVRVQTLHPDWDENQVNEEVDAIQAATSVVNPVSFGLGGEQTPPGEQEEQGDPAEPVPPVPGI